MKPGAMMAKFVYDQLGNAFAFIEGEYIHSVLGQAIGQLRGTHIHKSRASMPVSYMTVCSRSPELFSTSSLSLPARKPGS